MSVTLLNLSGSNVNYCYVVFDALDTADGATKLATVGTREVFKIGEVERIFHSLRKRQSIDWTLCLILRLAR